MTGKLRQLRRRDRIAGHKLFSGIQSRLRNRHRLFPCLLRIRSWTSNLQSEIWKPGIFSKQNAHHKNIFRHLIPAEKHSETRQENIFLFAAAEPYVKFLSIKKWATADFEAWYEWKKSDNNSRAPRRQKLHGTSSWNIFTFLSFLRDTGFLKAASLLAPAHIVSFFFGIPKSEGWRAPCNIGCRTLRGTFDILVISITI